MTTKLYLTRDSVAAGDDCDAPHRRTMPVGFSLADQDALRAAVEIVANQYLPSVAGRASWAAFSNLPLAVISNVAPRLSMSWFAEDEIHHRLDVRSDGLHIHFAYLGTVSPTTAFDALQSCLSAWGQAVN